MSRPTGNPSSVRTVGATSLGPYDAFKGLFRTAEVA